MLSSPSSMNCILLLVYTRTKGHFLRKNSIFKYFHSLEMFKYTWTKKIDTATSSNFRDSIIIFRVSYHTNCHELLPLCSCMCFITEGGSGSLGRQKKKRRRWDKKGIKNEKKRRWSREKGTRDYALTYHMLKDSDVDKVVGQVMKGHLKPAGQCLTAVPAQADHEQRGKQPLHTFS